MGFEAQACIDIRLENAEEVVQAANASGALPEGLEDAAATIDHEVTGLCDPHDKETSTPLGGADHALSRLLQGFAISISRCDAFYGMFRAVEAACVAAGISWDRFGHDENGARWCVRWRPGMDEPAVAPATEDGEEYVSRSKLLAMIEEHKRFIFPGGRTRLAALVNKLPQPLAGVPGQDIDS